MASIQESFDYRKEAGSSDGRTASVQMRVASLLLEKLSEECERYCVLTGYEELPEKFDSDIDFMVSARDFGRIPQLIDGIARATGTYLFQAIPHEASARAFRIAAADEERLVFIQPDSCSDYRHFGKLWLPADEVLAARRMHPRGFWIPRAAHEFIYYLIKRVNKRDVANGHGARLSCLYSEDSQGCEALLQRFFGAESAKLLAGMAATQRWLPLMHNMERYRREMRERRRSTPVTEARHTVERILQPTGGWIAFVGPDGCGKSSVIDAVAAEFTPALQKVVRFHLRPKSLPARAGGEIPVTDPHGQPVRGAAFSVAKMLYLFADYWLGYFSSVRAATMRTKLVIFDRYFYDILVDPKRVLYGGPRWLPKLLARFVPRPDLVFLLNAEPEVLWTRKQEVPYEEVARQQREFLKLARDSEETVVIDAARPLPEVVLQVREATLEYFSRRTRQRLGLDSKDDVSGSE